MKNKNEKPEDKKDKSAVKDSLSATEPKSKIPETGGRGGLDPSRFGDWEIAGKCVDF
jgi:hypothetical protein